MGRKYAGILALVAISVVLLQALRRGSSFDAAMTFAACWTATLATAGWVIGLIAEQTVEQSVQARMEAELAGLTPATETPGELGSPNAEAAT